VLIEMTRVITQIKFITNPAFIISTVFIELCPNTIALGAVATGSAKAYEQTIPAGRVRYIGLIHIVTAILARIGTNTFAVAVFEATFVILTVTKQTMKLVNQRGRDSRFTKDRRDTSREDRPDTSAPFASANPPPSRKMTPQHIFVSINLQVIKEGEFFRLFVIEVKGQKS